MKAIKYITICLLIFFYFQLSSLAQIPTNVNYRGKKYVDYSFDYGESWTRLSVYLNTDKNRIKYDGLNRKYFSDDYGKHWKLIQQNANIEYSNSVVVFPNPISAKQISLSFILQDKNIGNVTVKIYNVQYRMLLSKSFQVVNGKNTLDIDLTNEFTTGHYFVHIEIDEQLFVNNFTMY